MKKFVLLVMTLLIAGAALAVDMVKVSPALNSAIAKYKQQNYTACVQELKPIIAKEPDNTLAQYYLAIAYVQLGMKEEAKVAFEAVITKDNVGGGLATLSKKALACYDGTGKCPGGEGSVSAFVKSKDFMSAAAKDKIREAQLQQVKDTINSGEKSQDYANFKLLNDASPALNQMPTNEEIANAVKVLAKAGFNPYGESPALNSAIASSPASAQLTQLNALMGQTNSSNNGYNNLLPYLMAQSGTEGSAKINPQLLQSMMMSQMMSSFDFSNNSDRNY